MNALPGAHDSAVQIIDSTIVRAHKHAACITRKQKTVHGTVAGGRPDHQDSCVVDTNGLPARLALTAGEAHDTSSLASFYLASSREQRGGQTVAMMPTGPEPMLSRRALGQTSPHGAIAKSRSASARFLLGSQLGRAVHQQDQGLPSSRDALRQASGERLRIRPACFYSAMAAR